MKKWSSIFILLLFLLFPLKADEGMFYPHQLTPKLIAKMKSLGFELEAEDIWKPGKFALAQAVVRLGGGTGSFVSPNGLILTNHHVAFGAIQRQSAGLKKDLIKKGFLAKTLREEIPAPGYTALILIDVKDVTNQVLKGVTGKKLPPRQRYKLIEKNIKKIIKKAEKGKKGYKCEVASVYEGLYYYLFTYLELKDIRIVYVPPESIGNYGGEIDNWMWPRHTGDFSFLRAYVAPDGTPADYSPQNVPYKPKVYMKISIKDLDPGDFAMVLGFPGRTMRHKPSYYIEEMVNFTYPRQLRIIKGWIDILEEMSSKSKEAKFKNAGILKGLLNAYKNWQGMLMGLKKFKLVDKKRAMEEEMKKFAKSDPGLSRFLNVFKEYRKLYDQRKNYREKQMLLRWLSFGSRMLSAALTLNRWSIEKEKKDIERKPGYMERDVPRLKKRLEMLKYSLDIATDKEVLKYFIKLAGELPTNQRIRALDELLNKDYSNKSIDRFIENLYSHSRLQDTKVRMTYFNMKRKQLLAQKDAFIEFAEKLRPELEELEAMEKEFSGKLQQLAPKYIRIYLSIKKDELVYPDANSTLRLNFGTIKGYYPRDAVFYLPQTTLTGVMEKDRGKPPFEVPRLLKRLYQKREFGAYLDPDLKDIPVNFLTTNDSTGGNSGSPVLNGKGELIGLLFDGNFESISADYFFNPAITRTICVDSRYILFITDKFGHASHILKELTIVR